MECFHSPAAVTLKRTYRSGHRQRSGAPSPGGSCRPGGSALPRRVPAASPPLPHRAGLKPPPQARRPNLAGQSVPAGERGISAAAEGEGGFAAAHHLPLGPGGTASGAGAGLRETRPPPKQQGPVYTRARGKWGCVVGGALCQPSDVSHGGARGAPNSQK